jgi:hypothetical protein
LADDPQDVRLVPDARDLDDYGAALPADVGLGHPKGVDALAQDSDGLAEYAVIDLGLRPEHHRRPALQVEAEQWLPSGCDHKRNRQNGSRDNPDERIPQ